MASGGLPPQHSMPPPRGWTPGATSEVAQNLGDEEIAKKWWEVSEKKSCGNSKICQRKIGCFDINYFEKRNRKNSHFSLILPSLQIILTLMAQLCQVDFIC